jgi:hypothetical protein
MKWRRKTFFIVCAFLVLIPIAFLVIGKSSPVSGYALGRLTSDDGSVGYFFSITNRSNRPLQVRLRRNEAPPKVSGVATIIHTTIQPKSHWDAPLCPPDEAVPWSATLEYLPERGSLMKKLQPVAAFLRLPSRDPQWITAQTIQIAK